MAEPLILFKLEEAWGLPSLSIPCIQVEAYIRLAHIPFAVETCASPAASPTGCLPALDTPRELAGVTAAEPGAEGEHAAATVAIDHLRRVSVDLDERLNQSERGDLFALQSLLESKLLPALLYSTWCEDEAFKRCTQVAFGKHLPFPLCHIYPLLQRRAIQNSFGKRSSTEVYAAASRALDAFSARLAKSGGPYLFGDAPSSADALLFGALVYLSGAPVIHTELKHKLTSSPPLLDFLSRVSLDAFSTPPPLSTGDTNFEWSQWEGRTSGSRTDARGQKPTTESELNRKGKIWLACAAAAIAGYIVLGGHYIQFGYEDDDFDEDEFEE